MGAMKTMTAELPAALSAVEMAAPRSGSLAQVLGATPVAPFAPSAVGFITALSRAILTNRAFRDYPELVAFAHWMRKRSLLDMQNDFETATAGRVISARGLALHIAPANVDTIFLYSMLLSLLAGNANIVRISSRKSDQIEVLIGVIDGLLSDPEHAEVATRLAVVRYPRDEAINRALSARMDARVLWGGDTSVMAMRAIPAQAHTRDISFPDRWSLAVFDAEHVAGMEAKDLARLAEDFTNDTYWFGQLACSSPRVVVWRGDAERTQAAQELFWPAVTASAARFRHELFAVDYVNKLVAGDEVAIDHLAIATDAGTPRGTLVTRVTLAPDTAPDMELHVGAGLFIETRIDALSGLLPLLERKTQSLVSLGITGDDWRGFISQHHPQGIDRIVAPGAALNFAPVWDGMDLMREFTREITIAV